MSPAFAYIALIGGLLFALSGGLGLWATFEFISSIDPAGLENEEQRDALARAERQMIIASSVTVILGASAVIVAFGLFVQRLWAIYSWLVLISLISLWTVIEFLFGDAGWLGTILTVLIALWSWVEFRTADVADSGEFTIEGAIQSALGSMAGASIAFAGFCLAGMVFGAILALIGELTGIQLLAFLSGTGAGFAVPVILVALLWFTLLVENERIRLAFMTCAFLTMALAIYASGG